MRTRHPLLMSCAVLAAFAAGAACARADLAQASPFLPSNMADSASKAGTAGPVELRGVMSTAQGNEYCIYDTVKKSSAWVGLNETGNAYVVKSADPEGESVTVEFQGRTMKLVLRAAKVASAGSAVPVQAGMAANPSAVTQSVVLNPRRRTSRGAWTPSRRRCAAASRSASGPPRRPRPRATPRRAPPTAERRAQAGGYFVHLP